MATFLHCGETCRVFFLRNETQEYAQNDVEHPKIIIIHNYNTYNKTKKDYKVSIISHMMWD